MTSTENRRLALVYDTANYVPTLQKAQGARVGVPTGYLDRQVIAKEFLDTLLASGNWSELLGVVSNQGSSQAFEQSLRNCLQVQMGQRKGRAVPEATFLSTFFPTPPASLLIFPDLPDPRYLWARHQAGPGTLAFCGSLGGGGLAVPATVQGIATLVTTPIETYDAIVCTSQAVRDFVLATTGVYCDFLRERYGGKPELRARLEVIPPGVSSASNRLPTPEEIQRHRQALQIATDEVAVLWAGQVSIHSRAHPMPLFLALAQAARTTGKKVHLLIAGWSYREPLLKAFIDGARVFAPNARVTLLADGAVPPQTAWQAADVFSVMDDSIHDSSTLPILQAMASALPVVASDWGGARDLVADGSTGHLIPTWQIRGSTTDTVARLLLQGNYEPFLAECNQTVAVDIPVAVQVFERLLNDAALRKRMGLAGRQRALDRFSSPVILRAHESLWSSQEAERKASLKGATGTPRSYPGVPSYPAPEDAFASFPSSWLDERHRLLTVAEAETRLLKLQTMALTSYADSHRVIDYALLREVLTTASVPCTIADLDALFAQRSIVRVLGRSTLAWLLKYGLLRVVEEAASATAAG